MAEEITRLNYYQLQFLGAEDFKAEQNYHRDMRRRHNIGPHRWGIVLGLELIEKAKPSGSGFDIFVQPGMAIDGFGREIFVGAAHKVDPADFQYFTGTSAALHEVWIAYREEESSPPGYGYGTCETEGEFNRVREQFRIVIDPKPPMHAPISVDGHDADASTIPEDESVPYQELPDSGKTRWLIRLGSTSWNPSTQSFESAGQQLNAGRVYAGIVAEEVLAPAGKLRLRPRKSFTAADIDNADFAFVEGRMRVKGSLIEEKDINLLGGKISFQTSAGNDDGVPLWIQRLGGGNPGEYDLRVHIGGDADGAKHRLTIGAGPAGVPTKATEKIVLAVRGDDRVDIPTGMLHFGAKTRQMISLYGTPSEQHPRYGIGVQAATLYFRTGGHFYWYKEGEHSDAEGESPSGTMQLHLDDAARLNFGTRTQQMLNLWSTSYGIGVQSSTLYFRSFRDFCWFRKGSHSDTRSAPGAGGTLVLKIDQNGDFTMNGNVSIAENINVAADANIADDANIAGDINAGGDINLEKGNAIVYGTGRYPIDLMSGEIVLSSPGNASGSTPITLTSRMPSVSEAHLLVALADISNENAAVGARWRVAAQAPVRVNDNTFTFSFNWQVDDIDGHLNTVAYVAMFMA